MNTTDSTQTASYESLEKNFQTNAASLLSEEQISQTLEKEKKIFENADCLKISHSKLIFGNQIRHTKELIRQNQPLLPIYSILSFGTECSMLTMLFFIIALIIHAFLNKQLNFGIKLPILIEFGTSFLFLLYFRHKKKYLRKVLLGADTLLSNREKQIQVKKTIQNNTTISLFITLFLEIIICILFFVAPVSKYISINLFTLFMIYIVFAVLSGIHNTLYESHFIIFLTTGMYFLTRHSSIDTNQAIQKYISLNQMQYEQHYSKQATKKHTETEFSNILRSRLITNRIYSFLGLLIFLILDFLCSFQLKNNVSVALILFLVICLLITLFLIIIFVSANLIIKNLTGKKI